MKNIIRYYYNLEPEKIIMSNENYSFYLNKKKYILKRIESSIEEINAILELNFAMVRSEVPVDEIVLNKAFKPFIIANGKMYMLFKLYSFKDEKISLKKIINYNVLSNEKLEILNRNDWITLWSQKIDHIEYQINQIGKKYPILCDSLSYYIGMSENAISYLKYSNIEIENKISENVISNKRITKNLIELYNPINIIIDFKVRNIAEYIKYAFFNDINFWSELYIYFKNNKLSLYEYRLLYARLLYPSYYFDCYNDIINGKKKEDEIVKIISKSKEYEEFLCDFYYYLKPNIKMPIINWLIKK